MNKLTTCLKILKLIENTKGNKAKANVLASTPEELQYEMKYLLWVAFDGFAVTNLNKIQATNNNDPIHHLDTGVTTFAEFKSLTASLSSAKAANTELRELASDVCNRVADKELCEILVKVLTKSLNIGISVKGINKVFPGTIFDNSPMLASSQKSLHEVELWGDENIVANIKFDGVRLITQRKNGHFEFYTRNFNRVPNDCLADIDTQLTKLHNTRDLPDEMEYFFDGELTSKERTVASGEINKMLSGTYISSVPLTYNIFDFVIGNVFSLCPSQTLPLKSRIETLAEFNKTKTPDITNINFAEYFPISFNEIRDFFDKAIENGEEGLIIKHLNSQYELARSKYWIKMKEIKTADLKVIDLFPGKPGTKYSDCLGGLVCKTEDGGIIVNVGSGFSDELREYIWDEKEHVIGWIVEVEYNTVINKKNSDTASLFLPRFKQFREDKTKADTKYCI